MIKGGYKLVPSDIERLKEKLGDEKFIDKFLEEFEDRMFASRHSAADWDDIIVCFAQYDYADVWVEYPKKYNHCREVFNFIANLYFKSKERI